MRPQLLYRDPVGHSLPETFDPPYDARQEVARAHSVPFDIGAGIEGHSRDYRRKRCQVSGAGCQWIMGCGQRIPEFLHLTTDN
ncbi:hypothetical protein SBA2_270098 [Acidobacteriia bacterium SbA2]|nr:hypothetical protein SBA2_270098 [Acidobacteriia bacterium SbA2]